MANKKSNVPYDQIPHVVLNHPQTTPDHKEIMRVLFKVLKDVPICIYTNECLSINCRIPLRTIERKIPELNKMGFINITGKGRGRRISLGILFDNTAKLAVNKFNSAKFAINSAKSDPLLRQCGGHNNPYTNPYTKVNDSDEVVDKSRELGIKAIGEILIDLKSDI
jgi:hypothetical protein